MPQPTIQLPQPCPESWAAMTPTPGGRHCAACQQVVVDFTQKTDAELLAYFRQVAGGSTCGRFRAGQLERPLRPAPAPTRWRSWLGAALALGGVLGGGRALAQTAVRGTAGPLAATSPTGPATTPVPQTTAPPATPASAGAPAGPGGLLVVRGRVVDGQEEGLPGVTVLLQGTDTGVSTSLDGTFELTLPASAAGCTLQVSSVGYSTQRLPLAASSPAPLLIKLQEDVQGLMSGVVVVGAYGLRKPWPWHPRRLYQWGKYQLLRPFRQ